MTESDNAVVAEPVATEVDKNSPEFKLRVQQVLRGDLGFGEERTKALGDMATEVLAEVWRIREEPLKTGDNQ